MRVDDFNEFYNDGMGAREFYIDLMGCVKDYVEENGAPELMGGRFRNWLKSVVVRVRTKVAQRRAERAARGEMGPEQPYLISTPAGTIAYNDKTGVSITPDGRQVQMLPGAASGEDFMEFINPNSLKVIDAFVEPSLGMAQVGDRFQFQRLGYFNVDDDATSNQLVFNKTVGLRDSWAKQKPKQDQPKQNIQQKPGQPQRKAIDVIQQLGKKYTNLPETKQSKVKLDIQELAKSVSYEELSPLFGTALKKVGTRIAVLIALKVLMKNGLKKNSEINAFIQKALEDKNPILVSEAQGI